MATLNRDEQARVDRVAELEARRRAGDQSISDFELNRARQIAAQQRQNAELREERIAQIQADRAAQATAHQLAADQQAEAAQEAFLRQARLDYPGTAAEWEQDKPEILRQWRIRNAVDASTVEAEAARRMSPMLEY